MPLTKCALWLCWKKGRPRVGSGGRVSEWGLQRASVHTYAFILIRLDEKERERERNTQAASKPRWGGGERRE